MSPDARTRPRGSTGKKMRPFHKAMSYLLLSLIGSAMAVPFIWMLLASFKPRQEVESTAFMPRKWQPENYGVVLGMTKDPSTVGKKPMTLSDGTEIVGVDRISFQDVDRSDVEGRIVREDALLHNASIHTRR